MSIAEGDAVVLELGSAPAIADAELDSPAAEVVDGGDGLGERDRVVLGDEADSGSEGDRAGPVRRHAEGDERIERSAVFRFRWTAPRRRPMLDGKVRVLGDKERTQAAGLDPLRELAWGQA